MELGLPFIHGHGQRGEAVCDGTVVSGETVMRGSPEEEEGGGSWGRTRDYRRAWLCSVVMTLLPQLQPAVSAPISTALHRSMCEDTSSLRPTAQRSASTQEESVEEGKWDSDHGRDIFLLRYADPSQPQPPHPPPASCLQTDTNSTAPNHPLPQGSEPRTMGLGFSRLGKTGETQCVHMCVSCT